MSTYREQLKAELGKTNIHEVPQIEKIVVTIGVGSLVTRKGLKDFSDIERNLMTITGQKPRVIKSRKSVSNFKLREGMPVMLQVTLRSKLAYDFVERLVTYNLPRIRDFKGISPKKFDGKGNYNMGIPSIQLFAELKHDDVVNNCGMQITVSTTSSSNEEAQKLMEKLGFIFIK